jgi:hypothetical protein
VVLGQTRGCQHRLGGQSATQDQCEARGGGVAAVPWHDAAAIDVVLAVKWNSGSQGSLVAMVTGTRVKKSWAIGIEIMEGLRRLVIPGDSRDQ